jgi:hypothetical protein
MPSYFAVLTQEDEATVTLTPIGKKPFLASYEWNEDCTAFTVYGEPEGQVSYIVLATRDDPAIHVLRQPVEEDKTEAEKGKLLFPAAYGEPAEKGVAPAVVKPPVPEMAAPPSLETEFRRAEAEIQEREQAHTRERERIEQDLREREEQHRHMLEEHQAIEERRKQKEAAFAAAQSKPRPDRSAGGAPGAGMLGEQA